jgi:hypothetical protein
MSLDSFATLELLADVIVGLATAWVVIGTCFLIWERFFK